MHGTQLRGGRGVAAPTPVRTDVRHPVKRVARFAWEALSVALLGAALVLCVVSLVLPKLLGAVPLTILSGSMSPSMPAGALAVVRPVDATQSRVGDVLCYQQEPDDPTLVTHRVIAVSTSTRGDVRLIMRGDANRSPDPKPVMPEQVRGEVAYTVPYFGWVATRLNVGTGAELVRWAAWALVASGSLGIVRGLVGRGSRRR